MINATLFGGPAGHQALMSRVGRLEMSLGETCSGGCASWRDSPAGQERYAQLQAVNDHRKAQGLAHV